MNISELDLNLLHTLHALLEEESITRAALRLGRSPPAVSQALAKLRTTLQDPLLVRAGRGMVPSPRAQELRPQVASVLERIANVFDPATPFDPAASTRDFLVHGSDYIVHVLGVVLDGLLQSQAPNISLNFMPNVPADPDLVREGSIDLAIGVYTNLHPEIRIQKLFDESFVCVVRRDHPSVRSRLSLERYADLGHVQIAPRGRAGGVVDDALAAKGMRRRVLRRVPFFYAGLTLAARTDLILTVPRRLAMCEAERHGLRILDLPLPLSPYPITQIWHPRSEADPGHRWFRATVAEAARSTSPKPARRRRR